VEQAFWPAFFHQYPRGFRQCLKSKLNQPARHPRTGPHKQSADPVPAEENAAIADPVPAETGATADHAVKAEIASIVAIAEAASMARPKSTSTN
jgi:hypothetical protein